MHAHTYRNLSALSEIPAAAAADATHKCHQKTAEISHNLQTEVLRSDPGADVYFSLLSPGSQPDTRPLTA